MRDADSERLQLMEQRDKVRCELMLALAHAIADARGKGLPVTSIIQQLKKDLQFMESIRDSNSDAYETPPKKEEGK